MPARASGVVDRAQLAQGVGGGEQGIDAPGLGLIEGVLVQPADQGVFPGEPLEGQHQLDDLGAAIDQLVQAHHVEQVGQHAQEAGQGRQVLGLHVAGLIDGGLVVAGAGVCPGRGGGAGRVGIAAGRTQAELDRVLVEDVGKILKNVVIVEGDHPVGDDPGALEITFRLTQRVAHQG